MTAPTPDPAPAPPPRRPLHRWIILLLAWCIGLGVWAVYIALLFMAFVWLFG